MPFHTPYFLHSKNASSAGVDLFVLWHVMVASALALVIVLHVHCPEERGSPLAVILSLLLRPFFLLLRPFLSFAECVV